MNINIRKAAAKLHLWLGLPSGIVVFIVCITGCLYVFKHEIIESSEPWRFIFAQEKSYLLPNQALELSNSNVSSGISATAITYGEPTDALFVDYYDSKGGLTTVFINQYDGTVIRKIEKKPDQFEFFSFILRGHRSLWLPREIGKPIVAYSVLIFAITLITGLVLWWPKKWNRKTIKRSLTIKKKRLNFGLHNTLGAYVAILLLILCFTGLIWGLDWFGKSVYYIASGGEELKPYVLPKSDTLHISDSDNVLDRLYIQLRNENPNAVTFYFALPQTQDDVIRVSIVHERGSFYKTDNLFFDRYSLQPLDGQGPYAGKYQEATTADKLIRMNLEIHDGRMLGIFGKILVFIVSLVGASLPITGIIIWIRKQKK